MLVDIRAVRLQRCGYHSNVNFSEFCAMASWGYCIHVITTEIPSKEGAGYWKIFHKHNLAEGKKRKKRKFKPVFLDNQQVSLHLVSNLTDLTKGSMVV